MAQESRVCVLLDISCRIGSDLSTFDGELYDHDRPAERYGSHVQPALTCIAMHDPARRRGLWLRVDTEHVGELAVRLFAGREGDDSYVELREESVLTSHTMRKLLDVLSDARFAFGEGHASIGDWSAVESRFAPNEGGYCGRAVERCGATDDWAELYEMGAR